MTDEIILDRLQSTIPKGERKGMAQSLGVSANTLTNYLKGKTQIPHHAVQKIAEIKKVSVAWLLGETDDGGPGETTAVAETSTTYTAGEIDRHRDAAIGKLGTIISFLADTYGDLPSMMDDCIYQMKIDLRKSNPDFRQWEYEQQDKLETRRKKRADEDNTDRPGETESAANG